MIAIDTNILIYADGAPDPQGRHLRAIALIDSITRTNACVPIQVLGEFLNVSGRKNILPFEKAAARVDAYALLFDTPATTLADLADAGHLANRHQLQFFDAVIAAVARRAGAAILLSEDMHDGLELDGLTIINPFDPVNTARIDTYLAALQ